MPIITKVSSQKRPGRYNIFLDGTYFFSASEQTVAEFMLLKGQELTEEQIVAIKQFDAGAKATNIATNYLSYEPRTVFEVLQYLNKHDIDNESAQAAVSQLTEMGFLDDAKYAQLLVRQNLRIGTDGPIGISNKLRQKGVAPEIIDNTIAEIADDDWFKPGEKVLKSMKSKVGKFSRRELERKMTAKLLSHGFSSALASEIIAQINLSQNDEDQIEALKKQGIKAYKRFRRLPEGQKQNKIRNYLFTHGFTTSEIDAFLAGEIIPLAELDEY